MLMIKHKIQSLVLGILYKYIYRWRPMQKTKTKVIATCVADGRF